MTYVAKYINNLIKVNSYVSIIDSLFNPQDNIETIFGTGS